MDKLTLEDSFRELIKQRKWYVNSLRSPVQAKYDKATFQKGGKVPEERIRDYLAAAGWKCVQPELWEKICTLQYLTTRFLLFFNIYLNIAFNITNENLK